jgi:hypothetical protein
MSTEDNIAIAAVRREFTDALAEVLAENAAVCPVRRGQETQRSTSFGPVKWPRTLAIPSPGSPGPRSLDSFALAG